MKRLILWFALLIVPTAGCTFSHGGSQAITFNPFNWGTEEPALAPAHDHYFNNGEPMDLRR